MHTVLYNHTHSYNWQGRAETHVHYIAYPGGTELRKNQHIPWHLHRKNIAEHVSRGQGYVSSVLDIHVATLQRHKLELWYEVATIFYIIATTPVVSKRKGKIQTPCYPSPSASKQTPRSLLVATSWPMPPPPGSVYAREEEKSALQRFMTGIDYSLT